MFSDFDEGAQNPEGRGRAGVSLALSLVIFGLIAAGLAAAMATAHAVVDYGRRDVDVEFADLPAAPEPIMAEPEPEVATVAPEQRPAAQRQDFGPPDEIPDEQPEEAEGELVDAGDTGPLDGFVDGGDGEGELEPPPAPAPEPPPAPPEPAPRQVRETISPPSFLGGCTGIRPEDMPRALITSAATVRIDVRMMIGPDGRVIDARVLRGHELVPDELVLRCARDRRFEPARLPDGTAVPFPIRRRFTLRPENL